MLSDTAGARALERGAPREQASTTGSVRRRDFVFLGLVVEGGPGLATADDRRFLARSRARRRPKRRGSAERVLKSSLAIGRAGRAVSRAARSGTQHRAGAAGRCARVHQPSSSAGHAVGLIRTAPRDQVVRRRLSTEEVEAGISDRALVGAVREGRPLGRQRAAPQWRRDNPIVIDWSPESVALLRRRARQAESLPEALLPERAPVGPGRRHVECDCELSASSRGA